jgi:3-hydroxybutyrate dehydrogenase
VIATDRDADSVRETARLGGDRVTARVLDVTQEGEIARLAAELAGPVHVLVNNAGIQYVSPLENFPPERWGYLIDVMLKGPALLTRVFLPGMRKAGYGRVINIGSMHSLVASPFKSAYNAAKHGLLGFAKTIALETADVDITVNTICPSYMRTPLVDAQIAAQAKTHGIPEDDVIKKIMLEPMPKKAFITSDEIAGAIEFLASAAARNVTGQTIVIDGGWTAR